MADLIRKPISWLVGVALIALAAWWLYGAWTAKPKAEARLGRNQAEAAAQSGADAVNTVGQAGAREAASDALSRTNEEEIRHAQGADAAVDPAARDAGIAALCRREAYRNNPRCANAQP